MAEILAAGFPIEDRRRGEFREPASSCAELGVLAYGVAGSENVKTTVIATARSASSSLVTDFRDRPTARRVPHRDPRSRRDRCRRADGDGRRFDADDIDAAIAELDARYLAGEAAAARTCGQ